MTVEEEICNMNNFNSKINFITPMSVKLPFPQDNINCTSHKYKTISAYQDMQRN